MSHILALRHHVTPLDALNFPLLHDVQRVCYGMIILQVSLQ